MVINRYRAGKWEVGINNMGIVTGPTNIKYKHLKSEPQSCCMNDYVYIAYLSFISTILSASSRVPSTQSEVVRAVL